VAAKRDDTEMKNILAHANRDVLRQYACSRVLLAFDYDGTLAPVVADPDAAFMRGETRALVGELAARRPCVIISGRARADAVRRLRGLNTIEVIGNHGIEPWQSSRQSLEAVRVWRTRLASRLASLQGVVLEDKVYSLAIHYRQSREKRRARAEIQHAAAELGDLRVIRGKLVINLLPRDAPHKGIALEKARARFGCDTAIYVGDDETDEDVFALDQPGRLLSIRVGESRRSQAPYFIRSQADVDRLLRALLDGIRERSHHEPRSASR
jgi:trehalose 6-phosphate phosphatase